MYKLRKNNLDNTYLLVQVKSIQISYKEQTVLPETQGGPHTHPLI